MNWLKRNIPNTITCGNLLCGCLAIVKAFEGDLVWAAYLVGIAAVLDFFDGFVARALKVSSPIGKDLDSLADMVTFGVVPGVVMFNLFGMLPANMGFAINSGWHTTIYGPFFFRYVSFLIPVFSAVRLAKFNNDTRQTESFIGLPTPANAILICSLPLILFIQFPFGGTDGVVCPPLSEGAESIDEINLAIWFYLMNPLFLFCLSLLTSFLLIAPLPLFSLKFKSFGWKGNEIRFTFLILSAALIGFLQFIGIPVVIVLYILMSVVNNLLRKKAS